MAGGGVMATIAVAAIAASLAQGAAVTATVAALTAAATVAAGFLDSSFIYPTLFGRPDAGKLEGPRLSSLSPQEASESVGLNYCLGSRVRVGGNVIWMVDLEEVAVAGGGGGGKGGGGGGGSSTNYEYYASAMIAICEGEIESIVKVYADGKTFLNESATGVLGGDDEISVTANFTFDSGYPNNSFAGPHRLYVAGVRRYLPHRPRVCRFGRSDYLRV
jgi:hypothetical protein